MLIVPCCFCSVRYGKVVPPPKVVDPNAGLPEFKPQLHLTKTAKKLKDQVGCRNALSLSLSHFFLSLSSFLSLSLSLSLYACEYISW